MTKLFFELDKLEAEKGDKIPFGVEISPFSGAKGGESLHV